MKAWQLLDKPEKWTQGEAARNKDGKKVFPQETSAVCWCLRGAVWHLYPIGSVQEVKIDALLWTVIQERYNTTPVCWNDNPVRTYEEVHALLKELDV